MEEGEELTKTVLNEAKAEKVSTSLKEKGGRRETPTEVFFLVVLGCSYKKRSGCQNKANMQMDRSVQLQKVQKF